MRSFEKVRGVFEPIVTKESTIKETYASENLPSPLLPAYAAGKR
jgi:hypothetical protein